MNCDGAVSEDGQAACRRVLRDHNGTVIFSYACKINVCSIPQNELWVRLTRLELDGQEGLKCCQLNRIPIIPYLC